MKTFKLIAVGALLALAFPAFAQVYNYYPASGVTTSYISPAQPTGYCPPLSYNLYVGLSDYYTQGQVTQLQQYLSSQGYYQPVTGYFGSLTRSNVAQLQQTFAVYPITGGVGPLTRAAIARTCQGTVVVPPTSQGLSVYPSTGQAPLTVTFTPTSQVSSGYFAIQFGDGQSQYMLQGLVTHTYTQPGTYTATATTDLACLHSTPQCYTFAAQQLIGTATVVVGQGSTQTVPKISSVTPIQGPVGTAVTITGSGFSSNNTVYFGTGGTQNVPSYNGTTISYTIPSTIGPVCQSGYACPQYLQQVTPGIYNISVATTYGQSNAVPFTVSGAAVTGAMTVTSPTQGQQVQNGSQLTISWGAPYLVTNGAYVVDLYTTAGSKVGTIAIQNAQSSSGTYTWSVPRVPNIYFCTMQYPNGLCGQNLVGGSYFVRVSLVPGSGFDNQAATASADSGAFSVY